MEVARADPRAAGGQLAFFPPCCYPFHRKTELVRAFQSPLLRTSFGPLRNLNGWLVVEDATNHKARTQIGRMVGMFPFFMFDSTMMLLIPAALLAMWAQWKVKSTYQKYRAVHTRGARSGATVAAGILSGNRLGDVPVESVAGSLTDHYDPRKRTVRLSEENYRSDSIAAVSVAAHEVGHAMQHGSGYGPLAIRHNLVPVANLGSTLAFPLFLGGLLFSWPPLMDIGIALFALAVLFSVITLPVEFNASRRAMVQLKEGGYMSADELVGARRMLTAAALTYVAATAMALTQLLRLLVLRGRND